MAGDELMDEGERWVRQHGLQSPLDLKYAFKNSAEASAAGGPSVARLWEITASLPLKVDSGWEFLVREAPAPPNKPKVLCRGDKKPIWSGVRPGHHFSKASETGAKCKAAEAAIEVALAMGEHGRLGR